MAKDLLMPALSPSMTEGTVAKWLKKEGDAIKIGEPIADVETDKTTLEMTSYDNGVLLKILVPEGERVEVNTRIAIIGAKGEALTDDMLKAPAPSVSKEEPKAAPATSGAPEEASAKQTPEGPRPAALPEMAPVATLTAEGPARVHGERVKSSPLARKLAVSKGIDITLLSGSGPGGRVVKRDVLNGIPAGKAGVTSGGGGWGINLIGPITNAAKLPLSGMRKVIAKRLQESKSTIPHFYLTIEVDAGPISALRVELNDALSKLPKPIKLSVNDFITKAAAEAVRKVPAVNASWAGDHIVQHGDVDISFAVSIPDGLITPIIKKAQDKNIRQISEETKVLAGKAREGKLKPEEFQGGTFTLSNLGMKGIDSFSAIINPPQAAILAIGTTVKKPVVNERDEIVIGQRMCLTLSCDHRVVDGAVAADYMAALRTLIEKPSVLLI
ncbi:MAG: pyruvate dehydrogenase complex dihydrolipoamide acetyltransferase [Candidatus Methylacidiphilales bacterium]|nr:pyruvate dehydrogenase complex dihydrolipoamide acetyltransferase [Candidatus Methylacidiphilales bacterium]